MVTFRTLADIPENRRVVLNLPPETPLGEAELVITIAAKDEAASTTGGVRKLFGTVQSDNPSSADNDRIDQDLANCYGNDQG